MSDGVWISFAPGMSQIWANLTNEWHESGQEDRMHDLLRRNGLGESLERDSFPAEFFGQLSAEERDYKFGDFLVASGLTLVSARVAELMSQFDLGGANLYPVPILKKDKSTAVEGDWFLLNFGNAKSALAPDASNGVRQLGGSEFWRMPSNPKDGDVAVSASALEGPDVWVDPTCRLVFFVSERLANEIKRHSFSGHYLKRCNVV